MEEEVLRGLVRVTRRQRDQTREDPEEWNTLNDNVCYLVRVYSLNPNTSLCDRRYRRSSEECVEKKESTYESD